MRSVIDALNRKITWILTILSHRKKALGFKWVYKIKRKSDESIDRYNARLVILGNTHVGGLNFHETFVPVAKMVTLRTSLYVVVAWKELLYHVPSTVKIGSGLQAGLDCLHNGWI